MSSVKECYIGSYIVNQCLHQKIAMPPRLWLVIVFREGLQFRIKSLTITGRKSDVWSIHLNKNGDFFKLALWQDLQSFASVLKCLRQDAYWQTSQLIGLPLVWTSKKQQQFLNQFNNQSELAHKHRVWFIHGRSHFSVWLRWTCAANLNWCTSCCIWLCACMRARVCTCVRGCVCVWDICHTSMNYTNWTGCNWQQNLIFLTHTYTPNTLGHLITRKHKHQQKLANITWKRDIITRNVYNCLI